MEKLTYLICFFFLFTGFCLFGQTVQWQNYIAPSKINDFLETEETLWMATDAGIYIIDKSTFEVEHWTKNSMGLPSNQVESLSFHPQSKQLFIGTYDVGVAFRAGESWESIPYPEAANAEFDQLPKTYALEFDDNGKLWVGVSTGLLSYSDGDWSFFNEENGHSFLYQVWEVEKGTNGEMIFGGHVLSRTHADSLQIISPTDFNDPEPLFSYSAPHVHIHSNGEIWFFTDIGNVGKYDGEQWEIFSPLSESIIVPFNQLSFFKEDEEGKLWMYMKGYGFFTYDGVWEEANLFDGTYPEQLTGLYFLDNQPLLFDRNSMYLITENELNPTPFSTYPFEYAINDFRKDQNGALWVNDGYYLLRNLNNGDTLSCIIDDVVTPFTKYEWEGDDLWIVSGNTVYQKVNGTWHSFNHTNSILPDAYGFRHLVKDDLGRIWLEVYELGLYLYDGIDWKHFDAPIFAADFIRDMVPGTGGSIWISAWNGTDQTRIVQFDGEELKIYSDENSNFDLSYVQTLYFEPVSQRIWAGGNGDHLLYFNGNDWERFDFPWEIASSYPTVNDIWIQNDEIFVTTIDRTFGYFNGEYWSVYTPNNSPLDNENILAIGLDSTSRLWISHSGQHFSVDVFYTENFVSPAAEIAEIEKIRAFSIFPNPVNDVAQLNYTGTAPSNNAVGKFYDLQGACLKTIIFPSMKHGEIQALEVDDLPSGIYLFTIKNRDRVETLKVVK